MYSDIVVDCKRHFDKIILASKKKNKKVEVSSDIDCDSHFQNFKYGIVKENFTISSPAVSKKYAKPIGDYSLLSFGEIVDNENKIEYIKVLLVKILKEFLGNVEGKRILVIGLGNKYITADSLGIEVVKNIVVTNKNTIVNAMIPSVKGLTGIESSDIVGAVVKKTSPDIIIAIDSLCASDISRLGTCIQINNGGIIPGAGVNNTRKGITPKNMNCKVISIGVPLVVYVSTILNTMQEENVDTMQNLKIDEEKRDFERLVVTPSDIDVRVQDLGKIIAIAINKTLLGIDGYYSI